jgi:phosphohistidine phosphatase
MKVLLIRHAIAEDQDTFARSGAPDEKRPLTDEGRELMRAGAHGLKRIAKEINVIATSPLTRAQQTAEIVAEAFPSALRETTEAMTPEARYPAFLEWLGSKRQRKCVAAVGHEPHISGLASWLLGSDRVILAMKKGSVLLLEFDDEIRPGAAQLRWFLTPAQLRMLADR